MIHLIRICHFLGYRRLFVAGQREELHDDARAGFERCEFSHQCYNADRNQGNWRMIICRGVGGRRRTRECLEFTGLGYLVTIIFCCVCAAVAGGKSRKVREWFPCASFWQSAVVDVLMVGRGERQPKEMLWFRVHVPIKLFTHAPELLGT